MRFFVLVILSFILSSCANKIHNNTAVVVLISANAEWKVIKEIYQKVTYNSTPWGEFFALEMKVAGQKQSIIFFHEGWGKVAAAGATQYAIDRWNPATLVNLGTCGGFEGLVKKYEILLIDQAIIYDIKEAMGDSEEAIRDYSTQLDLSWINFPDTIKKTVLVSADRDLVPDEIEELKKKYKAIAGDWETGAIAYVSNKNNKRVLILRGVTDLVNSNKGEAYNDPSAFTSGTEVVMKKLIEDLPGWLEAMKTDQLSQSK